MSFKPAIATLTAKQNARVRRGLAPAGSINADLLALPQQRTFTGQMRGGIYLLPRTGAIVTPTRDLADGADCIVLDGNGVYPRGGHDIWVPDLELQTAVELDLSKLNPTPATH